MGAVKFWVTQLRILDREFFVIKELKKQFPGDPAVLARETKYFQTKELLAQTVRTIPTKQQNAILKAMNRRGMLGRVVRLPRTRREASTSTVRSSSSTTKQHRHRDRSASGARACA